MSMVVQNSCYVQCDELSLLSSMLNWQACHEVTQYATLMKWGKISYSISLFFTHLHHTSWECERAYSK